MQNKRVLVFSVLGIAFLILVAYIIVSNIRKNASQETNTQEAFTVLPTQTLTAFTPTATSTEAIEPGSAWRFVSMEKHAIHQNGYWYDVGTFENVARPDIRIRAMCMAPLWPSPEIGAVYLLNPYDILYPQTDNSSQNLQRFQVLK